MRVLFSDDLLQSLAAAPPARRKRYSDQVQRGLVFDLTSSGGYFGFRYSFGGQQRMLGLGRFGVVDLASVRQEVTELIHDLVDGHDPGVKRRAEASFLTLKQFYEEQYLPHVRTYKVSEATDANYFANHLLPFFGEAKMAEISRSEVSRFVSQKQAEGLKPSSINRYLMTLRHAFNVALEWDVPGVSRNPLQRYPLLKENNLLNRFLTGEEAERLKAALAESPNRELGAIVGFLLVTGARKTEVLEARWDQFDLERRQWRVPKAKSGYHRFIPISDGALAVLRAREALKAAEPSGGASPWVFPNPATGKPYVEIFNAWNTARRKAGLPDPLRRRWSMAAPPSTRSRSCWGIPVSGPRSATPTLRRSGCSARCGFPMPPLARSPRPARQLRSSSNSSPEGQASTRDCRPLPIDCLGGLG
jgi:integrase